ncbi:MAG: flavodoxin-dependent (E)-4-hydroxy-3-methylbut-2-enyl-diphosphate synthase, partial [Gammaproteobacteria bacterium]|nr:flavodoxin-dependent (E)-4-hydroxy-3-methylbut-2-enyl-diphosphate synthase [Gammaproteobacteria bacterium]
SRQEFDVIAVMNELEARLEDITTPVDVAVIGCKVNGPGEAKEADIGLAGASPANLIYRDGQKSHKITNENMVDELERLVRDKVSKTQTEAHK